MNTILNTRCEIRIASLLFSFLLLCGCLGQEEKRERVTPEIVTFLAEDGPQLSGTYYPSQGETAVILAHMLDGSQAQWEEFAADASGRGFAILTFDFRCHGESECHRSRYDPNNLKDLSAAYDFLKKRGHDKIVCAGASLGGIGCVNLSLEKELAGLAVIGGAFPIGSKNYPEDLKSPSMPKLFVNSDKDPRTFIIKETNELYEVSPEPKQLKVFATRAHGTEIFQTKDKKEFTNLLLKFLEECRKE